MRRPLPSAIELWLKKVSISKRRKGLSIELHSNIEMPRRQSKHYALAGDSFHRCDDTLILSLPSLSSSFQEYCLCKNRDIGIHVHNG